MPPTRRSPTRKQANSRLSRTPSAKRGWKTLPRVGFGDALSVGVFELSNGLRILTLPDPNSTTLSYHTWYRVGSRDETPGKTGLAHLFEHLMFSGTKNKPAGAFDYELESVGAECNAATWTDWTYYYENLPQGHLELAVSLESDRMQHLVLSREQVASEKDVVANERRYRVDDDVNGSVGELLYAKAFRHHPYRWPTIGWMGDIKSFTVGDCQRFYRRYYAPNQATIVIAGSFDEAAALRLVSKYYGAIPRGHRVTRRYRSELAQTREKKLTVRKSTQVCKLALGYRAPAYATDEAIVLAVIHEILMGGESARLVRELVRDRELANDVSGSIAPFRDDALYEIWISLRQGSSISKTQRLFDHAMKQLATRKVSERELEKSKSNLELAAFCSLEGSAGKAEQIGFHDVVTGNPAHLFERVAAYKRVTANDVLRVANKYLVPSQRTLIEVRPGKGRA